MEKSENKSFEKTENKEIKTFEIATQNEEEKQQIYNGIDLFYSEDCIIKSVVDAKDLVDGLRKSESIFNKIAIANSLNDTAKLIFMKANKKSNQKK